MQRFRFEPKPRALGRFVDMTVFKIQGHLKNHRGDLAMEVISESTQTVRRHGHPKFEKIMTSQLCARMMEVPGTAVLERLGMGLVLKSQSGDFLGAARAALELATEYGNRGDWMECLKYGTIGLLLESPALDARNVAVELKSENAAQVRRALEKIKLPVRTTEAHFEKLSELFSSILPRSEFADVLICMEARHFGPNQFARELAKALETAGRHRGRQGDYDLAVNHFLKAGDIMLNAGWDARRPFRRAQSEFFELYELMTDEKAKESLLGTILTMGELIDKDRP